MATSHLSKVLGFVLDTDSVGTVAILDSRVQCRLLTKGWSDVKMRTGGAPLRAWSHELLINAHGLPAHLTPPP